MRYGIEAECQSRYSDESLPVWCSTWETERDAQEWIDAQMSLAPTSYVKVPGWLVARRDEVIGFRIVPVR